MIARCRKVTGKEKGFTLLEVMVAITILLLVILPLATLYVKSLTVIQNAALYSQAIQLGQERVELCQALDYGSLFYYNEIFTPGFPYHESPLPPSDRYDGNGDQMTPCEPAAYDNRDNPDTDYIEWYFDPTHSGGLGPSGENYPVPVYRDYYNNYTGQCLDPNFNGLCDDDLDGDGDAGILGAGGIDMEDIEIATNGRLVLYSDPPFSGTPAAALGDTWVPGDGLFDTIVEGSYVSSMDPMYRKVQILESPAPILDYGLLLDQSHRAAVSDYRYREATFKNFVRMTTFLDPTPTLPDPRDWTTWVDQLYIRDRQVDDLYTPEEIQKLFMCLNRDLPLSTGLTNFDVGPAEQGFDEIDPFGLNYSTQVYGMRVIVTVFYLTGQGEVELVDPDGDGVYEELPMESYGGARRVRLERTFYNTVNISGNWKSWAPPRRYILSTVGTDPTNPARALTLPDNNSSNTEHDPCDIGHRGGLPYLTD
ncbi:MAG: type II secretion system protein [bacterium]|nr:type II secretion system protein [bacterium]